jgi:hypothetical protein
MMQLTLDIPKPMARPAVAHVGPSTGVGAEGAGFDRRLADAVGRSDRGSGGTADDASLRPGQSESKQALDARASRGINGGEGELRGGDQADEADSADVSAEAGDVGTGVHSGGQAPAPAAEVEVERVVNAQPAEVQIDPGVGAGAVLVRRASPSTDGTGLSTEAEDEAGEKIDPFARRLAMPRPGELDPRQGEVRPLVSLEAAGESPATKHDRRAMEMQLPTRDSEGGGDATKAKVPAPAASAGVPGAATPPGAMPAIPAIAATPVAVGPGAGAAAGAAADVPMPAPMSQPAGTDTDADELARLNGARVARGLRNAVQQGGGAVTLRLTPPDLGTVRVQLQIQGTSVAAQFHADNESARSLLNQQLSQLRRALEGQGLQVDRLTVQPMQNPSNAGQTQQEPGHGQGDGRSRGFMQQEQRGGGDDPQQRENGSQQQRRQAFERLLLNEVA